MRRIVQQKKEEGCLTMSNKIKCRGCKKEHDRYMVDWMRYDYDGLYTGIYCDECYNSGDPDKYPYRKDNYKLDEIDY